ADGRLPQQVCRPKTPEKLWPELDGGYEFLFSLVKNCYVVTGKKGEVREGYYNSTDRGSAAINLTAAEDKQKSIRGIGVLQLDRLEKYVVDRMGRRVRVMKEPDPRKA
ncbi:MAG: hypothetical protein IJ034_06150, partial [Mailhella sp.]|nr:hypothetical protein [Mailhella sp.]